MAAPGIFGSRNRGEKKERPKLTREGLRVARKMLSYVRPYLGVYTVGMVFLVLSTLSTLAFPYILGQMLNTATGDATWSLQNIDQIALLLIGLLLAQGLFSFLRVVTFANVTERSMADVRQDLYRKMLSLPVSFFDQRRVGELTSRITSDVQELHTVLSITLAEFFRQIATLIGGVTVVLYLSPELTLLMLLVFPPLVLVAVLFGRFIRRHSRRTQDDLANANVVVEETLHNISIVKAFTSEAYEWGRYGLALRKVVRNAIRTAVSRGGLISFIILGLFGSFVLVIWRGAHLVMDNDLGVGSLFSFIMIMVFIGGSLGGLPDVYSQIVKAVGATERLYEILGEDEETDPRKAVQKVQVEGRIAYEDLRFTYPSRPESEVLKGINLAVGKGEKIALAGPSGAGKSTVVQLLMRFYQTEEGRITIDGKDIREFDVRALRENIGIVPQEVILFGGTIRENIAYGKRDATDAEIEEAAKKANAYDFITSFPEGFETVVGERGVKLSGGQRQRLAIARAVLKDPAILILDEATSSLDAESEHLVQEALNVLMKGRTTIIIAHRLATIRDVDRIYVLDQGEIVESGSHAELLEKPGAYARLVELQMRD